MAKSVALLLVMFFMVASCLMVVRPARSSVDDLVENSWVSMAPMRVTRSGLGVAVVNGKIYAIGGSAEDGYLGTNEEYDPATDTWTYKKPMPTPRERFGIAVYQNKIYCIGGDVAGGYFSNDSITVVNEVYDPATDTWETKKPLPTLRREVGANVVNGKIYLIGGIVPYDPSSTGFAHLSLNEVYDPETDSWSTKAEMPTAEISSRSAVIDSKIYIITGSSNQIYDAAADTWSSGTPLPVSLIGGTQNKATTGVNALKRVYVFGGGKTQVYDPETDRWTVGADMITTRSGFGVAAVNDVLYVIGGDTMTYEGLHDLMYGPTITRYTTNEQYTPFGYGTPDPTYDDTAPEITVASPANKTYCTADAGLNFSDVALDFTADEPVFSARYMLDGGVPVEISGNTTIAELPVGAHNVTVFGFDASGNMGVSETVFFTVAEPDPFPVAPFAVASTIIILASAGLLYFKKRKH